MRTCHPTVPRILAGSITMPQRIDVPKFHWPRWSTNDVWPRGQTPPFCRLLNAATISKEDETGGPEI